jgi:hypothetical protein
VTADATDSQSGVAQVRFFYQILGLGPLPIGSDSTAPYEVQWLFPGCLLVLGRTVTLTAVATDNCGNSATSPAVAVTLSSCLLQSPVETAARPPALTSDLGVPGGRGQIVLDGIEAFFPKAGLTPLVVTRRSGRSRVEAFLVEADGHPGTWRFEVPGAKAGSLRVVAGEVALVTADALVFRLKGRAGERVVFTFDSPASP